jgi:hypothetical protein
MPSYSYDYTVNRDQLIEDAYREIGVLGEGRVLTGNQIERGFRALNLLIGSLNQKDMRGEFVTVRKRATMFLQKNQAVYHLGDAATSYLSSTKTRVTEAYSSTTNTVAIAAGNTTITVASTANMLANDYVGVLLTDGTWEWNRILTIPGGTSYTIAAPGMIGTAVIGSTIVNYTTDLTAPVEVLTAVLRDTDGIDTPIDLGDTLYQYEARGDKAALGDPSSAYLEYNTTTDLHFDTAVDDASRVVRLVVRLPFSDMDASTDTFDCSKAGVRAIKYALAIELAPQNNKAITPALAALATDSMSIFLDENSLTTDAYFQPGAD